MFFYIGFVDILHWFFWYVVLILLICRLIKKHQIEAAAYVASFDRQRNNHSVIPEQLTWAQMIKYRRGIDPSWHPAFEDLVSLVPAGTEQVSRKLWHQISWNLWS